jgi:hypothetical protein
VQRLVIKGAICSSNNRIITLYMKHFREYYSVYAQMYVK